MHIFHKWLKFDKNNCRGCLICDKIQIYTFNSFDEPWRWKTITESSSDAYFQLLRQYDPYKEWFSIKKEYLKDKGGLTICNLSDKGDLSLIDGSDRLTG